MTLEPPQLIPLDEVIKLAEDLERRAIQRCVDKREAREEFEVLARHRYRSYQYSIVRYLKQLQQKL